jgi:hypothetical protein
VAFDQPKSKYEEAASALRTRARRFAGVSLSEDALAVPRRPDSAASGDFGPWQHHRVQRFVRRLAARR